MAGQSAMLSASATPTQKAFTSVSSSAVGHTSSSRSSFDRNDGAGLQLSATNGISSVRNLPASAVSFAPRASSFNPSAMPGPGSFSSELRSQMPPPRAGSRADVYNNLEKLNEYDDNGLAEQTLSALRDSLNREMKIKER